MDKKPDFAFASALMIARYGVDFVDDLVSGDLEVAEHAASEFSDILYNQGDIYAASFSAIPNLVSSLAMASPPVKSRFIFLLGGIAKADHVADGDISLIPQATIQVIEHWDQIERFLTDQSFEARLAALITLTDLARINLPGMQYRAPQPAYVGALPGGVEVQGLVRRLLKAIESSKHEFDQDWRDNCEVAAAFLTQAAPSRPQVGWVHPYWDILERDS